MERLDKHRLRLFDQELRPDDLVHQLICLEDEIIHKRVILSVCTPDCRKSHIAGKRRRE
jgi:hypothetical protein